MIGSLVTKRGKELLAQAVAVGKELKLSEVRFSDYAGDINENMDILVGVKHTQPLTSKIIDPLNQDTIILETLLPANVGGFYIETMGIYTETNELFALVRIKQTYKSHIAEAIPTDLHVKLHLQVSNASNITLTIDESVVLASREYVNTQIIEIKSDFDYSQELQDIRTTANEINTQKLISDLALEVSRLKTAISLRGGVGMIYTFAGATENIPSNFMLCDGRELSKADYSQLFQAIGTIYGESADGLSFKIPDLRGCFTRCVGGNADALGIKQGDAIRNIEFKIMCLDTPTRETESHTNTTRSYSSKAYLLGGGSYWIYNTQYSFDAGDVVPTANENRPLNMSMNYVIQVSE